MGDSLKWLCCEEQCSIWDFSCLCLSVHALLPPFFSMFPPTLCFASFYIFSTDSGEEQKTPFQIHFRVAGRNSLTGAHLGEKASKPEGLRDGLLEGWSYPF